MLLGLYVGHEWQAALQMALLDSAELIKIFKNRDLSLLNLRYLFVNKSVN